MARARSASVLWLLVQLAGQACGGTVEIGAGGGTSSASSGPSGGECVPCAIGFFTPYYEGIPNFCPGEERDKWDALLACACRADTCAPETGPPACLKHPTGDESGSICDGGSLGGECGDCLEEHCANELMACGGKVD